MPAVLITQQASSYQLKEDDMFGRKKKKIVALSIETSLMDTSLVKFIRKNTKLVGYKDNIDDVFIFCYEDDVKELAIKTIKVATQGVPEMYYHATDVASCNDDALRDILGYGWPDHTEDYGIRTYKLSSADIKHVTNRLLCK